MDSKVPKTTALDPTASGQVYRPRTTLGQRLWDIRARIVASGNPLLSWDDLDRELAERRGEPEGNKE